MADSQLFDLLLKCNAANLDAVTVKLGLDPVFLPGRNEPTATRASAIFQSVNQPGGPGFSALKAVLEELYGKGRGPEPTESVKPHLRTLDFSAFLKEKSKDFCGRDWLFVGIKEWARRQRGLLIIGDPGSGKSAIVAELVKRSELPERQIVPVLGYHFCQADTKETLRPGRFVRNLAAIIAMRCPAYEDLLAKDHAIKELLDQSRCDEDPGSALEGGILNPLTSLSACRLDDHFLLVDALDEALFSEDDRENTTSIVDVLGTRLDRLPFRIIATCKNDDNVIDSLGHLYKVRLSEIGQDANRQDVAQYIRLRLKEAALSAILHESNTTPDEVTRQLADKADGNFLFAKEALGSLEREDYSFEELNSLPKSLEGLYERFFRRRFRSKVSYDLPLRVLQVAVAAQAPLTKEQLLVATHLAAADLSKALRVLSPYLPEGHDNTYRVYHKSFSDWLTGSGLQGKLYYVDAPEGHRQLADFCWNQYKCAPQGSVLAESYVYRYGVKHFVESRQYKRAVDFLYDLIKRFVETGQYKKAVDLIYDLNRRTDLESEAKSLILQSTRMLSIALKKNLFAREEAKKIDPVKLGSLLEGLYMTEPLYGGIRVLVLYHRRAWKKKIFKRLLGTQDYVLRFIISEVTADTYFTAIGRKRSDEILNDIQKLVKHPDINHREVGSRALCSIYARDPERIQTKYLKLLANSETYPFRSILADLLINLVLQDKDRKSSVGGEIVDRLDRNSRFWHPIWDFHRTDVTTLKASMYFVRGERPPFDAADPVRRDYEVLEQTEGNRQELLKVEFIKRGVSLKQLLDSYYQLGIDADRIARAEPDLKDNLLEPLFEVLFAHPLWNVVEAAASVLASITDTNAQKDKAQTVIRNLFNHRFWEVRYGAAETAFQASFDPNKKLFSDAVKLFYKDDEPALRGNCAENLIAWILVSGPEKRKELLNTFQEQICYWLKDKDCWVLDHVYRLFRQLGQPKHRTDCEDLLGSGVSPLLEGEPVWYTLDRLNFLLRIEKNKAPSRELTRSAPTRRTRP